MFDLRRMLGRQAELHDLLATGLADNSHLSDIWRAMRAAVNAELGRIDEARADFAHVLRQLPTLPRGMLWPFYGLHLAEACAVLGDKPAAKRLYEQFRSCSGRAIVLGTGHYCCGARRYDDRSTCCPSCRAPSRRDSGLEEMTIRMRGNRGPISALRVDGTETAMTMSRKPAGAVVRGLACLVGAALGLRSS